MAKSGRFHPTIFLTVLAGVCAGAAIGAALYLWARPQPESYQISRPAVLSTMLIPLGCFTAWLLSRSRERAFTAAMSCFGLYFLSAFVAARLGTFFPRWNYFATVLVVQAGAGLGLAVTLGFIGRAEHPRPAGDLPGLDTPGSRGETRSEVP